MNQQDQLIAFHDSLTDVIQRFYDEFDLEYVQMLGVIEVIKSDMLADASEFVTLPILKEALGRINEHDDEEDEEDEE